jgi:hypothetical protein
MISSSLGWSGAAGGEFEAIWFQHCFIRVSRHPIRNSLKGQSVIRVSVRMHDRLPHGLSSPPGWGRFFPRADSKRPQISGAMERRQLEAPTWSASLLVSPELLPGQLVAVGAPKDGNRPVR